MEKLDHIPRNDYVAGTGAHQPFIEEKLRKVGNTLWWVVRKVGNTLCWVVRKVGNTLWWAVFVDNEF